jgi:hypothetical protein
MRAHDIFAALAREGVPFILIGGAALAAYGSTRVSLDTDIAIKTLDVDKVVRLSYRSGLIMVVGVDAEQHPLAADTVEEALGFLKNSRQGFMKFLSRELELDFVFDNPVPFMRLHSMGREVELEGVKVRLASLDHLRIMKELSVRTRDDDDKVKTDRMDLEFIDRMLEENR